MLALSNWCESERRHSKFAVAWKKNMALVRDIIFKRFPPLQQQILAERRKLNLKALKKVTVYFDPFRKDVGNIRACAALMYAQKTLKSNPKCIVRTEILRDRSEQYIHFELTEGREVIFKCANLQLLEIFQLMNKYITPLAPKEDEVNVMAVKKVGKKK